MTAPDLVSSEQTQTFVQSLAAGLSLGTISDSRLVLGDVQAASMQTDPYSGLAQLLNCPILPPALTRFCLHFPQEAAWVVRILSAAPYLKRSAEESLLRFSTILFSPPEVLLKERFSAIAVERFDDLQTLMRRLRQEKRCVTLLLALLETSGLWSIPRSTKFLTEFADLAVQTALRFLFAERQRQGRYFPKDSSDPLVDSGYCVLAMGKYGAFELNYSSDIDLIVLYEGRSGSWRADVDLPLEIVRLTQQFVRIIESPTEDGYVFRTDLRLRPDPGATPIAISVPAALVYYESLGQNWERAALIKARVCAGDKNCGRIFLEELTPFIWRRALDFVAIDDLHALRCRYVKVLPPQTEIPGFHLKLGPGGIREIEFFAQAQQLIAGGRNPELRKAQTLEALSALACAGWITTSVKEELSQAYCFLRRVEHALQMREDAQTHQIPRDPEAISAIAQLCGFNASSSLCSNLSDVLTRVQTRCALLFGRETDAAGTARTDKVEEEELIFTGGDEDPGTCVALTKMGYRAPKDVARTVMSWHFGRYSATRSAQALAKLTRITPALLRAFARTDHPDEALRAFDHLLSKLPMGLQFFSLLASHPTVLTILADVLGNAPGLAEIMMRDANVLDMVLDPGFLETEASIDQNFQKALSVTLEQARDYEDLLNRARRFRREQLFLIGLHILAQRLSPSEAGKAYSQLAETLIQALFKAAEEEFAEKNGRISGGKIAVLALGKLGSREMTAHSDLDLIVIYDTANILENSMNASSAQEKISSLTPATYVTRLTQRLIAALSAPTQEGTLYEVDFRLRPSGKSGPLATSFASFEAYQSTLAQTWEHMSLTRARCIAGDAALIEKTERCITHILSAPRSPASLLRDVTAMRHRIALEKKTENPWDIKQVRGGAIDLDFIAQSIQLQYARAIPQILVHKSTEDVFVALSNLRENSAVEILSPLEVQLCAEAARFYQTLLQIQQLCLPTAASGGPLPQTFTFPLGLQTLFTHAMQCESFQALESKLKALQFLIFRIFERFMSASPQKPDLTSSQRPEDGQFH